MSVFFTRRGKAAAEGWWLDYLESSGTQWIDTLVYLKSSSRIVIDAEILDTNTGTDHHIGSVYDGSVYNTIRLKSDRTAYQVRYGTQSLKVVAHSGSLFGRHLFERNANSFTIDGGTATTFTAGTWTQKVTYPLFCYKGNNGGNSGHIKMRLRSCRIWTDDVLVRDLWPRYDKDGVACMYDKVEEKYYYNAGTGEFVAGEAAQVNYVAYLRSNGTQYINTNYYPTNNTRVVCKVAGFPRTSYSEAVFGTRTSSSASDRFGLIAAEDSASYRSDFYNNNVAFASSVNFDGGFTIDKNGASTTLNETSTATNTSGTFKSAYPLFIFGYNTAGSLSMPAKNLAVEYFQIYESGALVHDYRAALDAEGVACFYDKVTGDYLYNSGTGVFETTETVYRTLTIQQTGSLKGYATVTANGVTYNDSTTVVVKDGTEISLSVGSSGGSPPKQIVVNNTVVSTKNYKLTVDRNYFILLLNDTDDSSWNYGQIKVTAQ